MNISLPKKTTVFDYFCTTGIGRSVEEERDYRIIELEIFEAHLILGITMTFFFFEEYSCLLITSLLHLFLLVIIEWKYSLFSWVFMRLPSFQTLQSPIIPQANDESYFLFGNLFDFTPSNCFHKVFHNYPLKYGKFVEFHLLLRRGLLITDKDIAKEILMKRPKHFQRLQGFRYATEKLGLEKALSMTGGDEWSKLRKLLSPSFNILNITTKYSLLVEEMFTWMERINETLQKDKNQVINT